MPRFPDAFEDAAIGMAIVALDGHWIRVNRALTTIVGYRVEELLRTTFQNITHAEDLAANDGLRARLLGRAAETFQQEMRFLHRRGHPVWILLSVSLVRSHDGEPLHFNAQTQDISQRKDAEQRLAASEERYRALSHHAPVGIFETDPRGVCRFVNRCWEELTGARSEQAIGRVWFDWIDEDDRERVVEAFRGASDHPEKLVLEFRVRGPRKMVWLSGSSIALRSEDGEPKGFLGTFMDISARKHSEAGLRHTVREKHAMLKEIHHRVKNNLQVISSLLYFQSKDVPDSSARALFQESHGRVRSMALIHERLYQSSSLSEIDFGDYARGLVSELQRAYARPDGTEVTTELASVRMDVDLAIPCGLILNELLSWALKRQGVEQRGEEVRVELKRLGAGEAMLAVSARGRGIAAANDAGVGASLTIELVKMFTAQIDGRFEVEIADKADFRVVFALCEQRARERDGGETS